MTSDIAIEEYVLPDGQYNPYTLQQAAMRLAGLLTEETPAPLIDQDRPEPTGWEAIDVAAILAGGCHIPPPSLYHRADGVCLFYAGKLHALNGEPESGKSWVAQHAATQTLAAGGDVCYIDFEDSPESVIGRLRSLGAADHHLAARLTYIGPDRPLGHEAETVIRARFADHRPALCVIDGVTEAMSIMGLNPLDNADTAKFFRLLPRRLTGGGTAVVLVDHVTKNQEDRGRWAIGSQHKMAALTGAAYSIEAVQPFGRNKAGFARITVTKDRPGWIRQHAAGATIAELHIASDDNGIVAELRPPASTGEGGFRPTEKMRHVSDVLAHGPALTKSSLYGAVRGNKATFDLAVALLIAEGHVEEHRNGQTVYHSSLRPFPDPTDGDEPDEQF